MPFCTKCGRRLEDGESCSCQAEHARRRNVENDYDTNYIREEAERYARHAAKETEKYARQAAAGVSDGISSVNTYLKDKSAFERGLKIVPDTIAACDDEVPIKQYDHVARLRSRLRLTWADGKMQITNKRLIFRAPGRNLIQGKIAQQHEFAIEDIAGVEIREDYKPSLLDFFFALIVMWAGVAAAALLLNLVFNTGNGIGAFIGILLGVIFIGITFILKGEKYYRKLLLSAAAFGCAVSGLNGIDSRFGLVMVLIFAVIFAIFELYYIIRIIFQHNLNITIKTKIGSNVVEIRSRSMFALLSYTGFDEVLPSRDTKRAIKEIGAIIHDVQTMGDEAVKKWR